MKKWKVKSEKWKWSKLRVFDFYEICISYRGVLNLYCYIDKKVQEKIRMGLKIWWSWVSGEKKIKVKAGRTVLNFHAKLQVLGWFFLFLSKKRQFFEISLKVPSLARSVPKPLMREAGGHLYRHKISPGSRRVAVFFFFSRIFIRVSS